MSEVLYLSREDVEGLGLRMVEIIDAMRQMFKEKGEGKTQMPLKPELRAIRDGVMHAMPAYIPNLDAAGIKWVSGFPQNRGKGLPYVNGLIILNDPQTGLPVAIMDCTWITAMRTGAATAVAAKPLARRDSSTVGIVACGVQGRSNLEAISSIFEIEMVRVYDIKPEIADRYADQMGEKLGLEIEPVRSVREAVGG